MHPSPWQWARLSHYGWILIGWQCHWCRQRVPGLLVIDAGILWCCWMHLENNIGWSLITQCIKHILYTSKNMLNSKWQSLQKHFNSKENDLLPLSLFHCSENVANKSRGFHHWEASSVIMITSFSMRNKIKHRTNLVCINLNPLLILICMLHNVW